MQSTRPLLAALLFCACATPKTPFEGHPVLASIEFEGNRSVSSSELKAHIATSPVTGFFTKTAHYYDADLFAIDQKRIVRWYNVKGFYEARITGVEEKRDNDGRVLLVVKIDEGRRARVKKMDFEGMGELSKSELGAVDAALPVHPGDDWDENVYDKAKDVLEEQLKEHGFAEATVSGRVEVLPESGEAHIVFIASLGRRYKFGKVVVTGNRAVAASEIIQAAGIDPGDPYRPSSLELAQQRIYNLGAFSGVRVGLEPLGDTPVAAVRVNVHEAPFQTFRAGAGLQIEETRWELPKLQAEYTNRNLLGGLRRLELATQIGWAFTPSLLNREKQGPVTLTSAQIVFPNVIIPGLDSIARAEFSREIQAGYGYDEVAARYSLLYRRGRNSISPALNFVRYFNANLDVGLDVALARGGRGIGILQDCPGSCTLTYPEVRYTYDARDNILEATDGFYGTIDLAQTLKPGTFTYFRVEGDVRAYRPMGRFIVLAGRTYYGALITEGDSGSPFTQRFFGGGQNWQRGYAPLRQGPKIGTAPDAQGYATGSVPTGGNGALLLTGELRVKTDFIFNHTGIVPFIDASRVTQTWSRPLTGRLEVAAGLGLRYITPFGPVRFDVGYLINPEDVTTPAVTDPATGATVIQATTVGTGCNQKSGTCIHESRFAYHLTLGEAF